MKNVLPIVIVSLSFLAGCASSPESAVDNLERDKEAFYESSGYNLCMQKVAAQDATYAACVKTKLAAQGYTDGVDCMQTMMKGPVCSDIERYNAEVLAGRSCDTSGGLTELDCMKLLQ